MTAVEVGSGYFSIGARTDGAARDIAAMFGRTEQQAEQSGTRSGQAHSKGFTGVLARAVPESFRGVFDQVTSDAEAAGNSAGTRMGGGLQKALTGLGAGVAVAAGVGAALLVVGNKFDEMSDTIHIKTGQSGADLDKLSEAAKNVGRHSTQGFEEAGKAVSEMTLRLGTTGKPLEELSTQFMNLARITGDDVVTDIDSVSGAFQRWGVQTQDQSSTLDFFYAVSQKTGTSVTDLSNGLQQFGEPLQQMGFGLTESAALLGRLDKAGVNTDQVMGSLKKGLATFAKAGEDPAKAMDRIMKSIKDAPTDIDATGKAIQVFGARAGVEMSGAIRSGKLSVDDLMTSIDGSHTTINEAADNTADFSENWAIFKNELLADVEPAASKLFSTLSTGLKWLTEHAIPAVSTFIDTVKNFSGTQDAVNVLKDAFSGLTTGAEECVKGLKGLYNTVEDNKAVFGVLAGIITTLMLPSLVSLAVGWATAGAAAVASGAETTAIWLMLQGDAIAGAASFVVAQASIVAGWVTSAGAAIASGAVNTAAWVSLRLEALSSLIPILAGFASIIAGWVSSAISATASALVIAAAWLIALGPVGLIIAAIALVVGAFVLLWNKCDWFRNFWKTVWDDIKAAASWVWDNILKPLFDDFMTALGWVGDKVDWFKNAIGVAFDLIGAAISFWWNSIVKPIWNSLGDAISWVVDHAVSSFEVFKTALGKVGDFFGNVVDGIKKAWEEVKKAVAIPINFVIETVWNGGLLKAWNAIAGWLPGLKEMTPLAPVKFARGGATSGGTPGKDSIPALLMADEHVFDTGDVAALGGQANVYALRHMLDLGIPFSWDSVNGLKHADAGVVSALTTAPAGADMAGFLRAINAPGYQDGGAVRPAWELQLEEGHRFAQSKNGHPYTWGFEDCSGYMSMIADKILGGAGNRQWATSSFPGGQPWAGGLGQGFSVGVHDDPGGEGGGHTAGTLSAVGNFGAANVESGGAHGDVAYGGPAAGADSSQWDGVSPGRFHLSIGADGAFESAGGGGPGVSGPAPAEQSNFLKDRVKSVIDDFMNPIKGMLPHPPPEFLGVPGKLMDTTVNKAVDTAFSVVGGLGSGLRSVYNGAKSAVGNVVGGVAGALTGGLLRDEGGPIWPGLNLIRNETGKPEHAFNFDQMARMTQFFQEAGAIIPKAALDIFNPGGLIPDPKALADRYTIKASDSQLAADSQQATPEQANAVPADNVPSPTEANGVVINAPINIDQVVTTSLQELQRMLGGFQSRQQMRYAGRLVP